MIIDSDESLQKMIMSAVDVLREPAGKKYRSMEDIQRDTDKFTRDFHSGLYFLHVLTVEAIIHAENQMKVKNSGHKEVRTARKAWERIRQLFRCINDSIVWTALFGREPSLLIRRTCLKRPRGKLSDQSPKSVMNAMDHLFAKGEALPIWNDATRCLDIGDITVFNPKRGVSFVEVKSGTVNEEILSMINNVPGQETDKALDAFFEKYGRKGIQQIERIVRQEERAGKLAELFTDKTVFDPFLGAERMALNPTRPLQRYDEELSLLLEELRSKDFATRTIDDCLHVLAINRRFGLSVERGSELVRQDLQNKMSPPGPEEVDCSQFILALDSSFDYPTAMPVMMRPWANEDIARVCLGHTEVYFAFDVNAWAKHLQSSRLTWSLPRLGRKESSKPLDERLLVIRERIPQISGSNGTTLLLGTQFLQLMLSEGIRPVSLAAYYDQIANINS